jgi:hypothetical protein
LSHLDATIRLFSPAHDLGSVRARKHRPRQRLLVAVYTHAPAPRVHEHESTVVPQAQVPGEPPGRQPFDRIAVRRDDPEVDPQQHLAVGEQRPRDPRVGVLSGAAASRPAAAHKPVFGDDAAAATDRIPARSQRTVRTVRRTSRCSGRRLRAGISTALRPGAGNGADAHARRDPESGRPRPARRPGSSAREPAEMHASQNAVKALLIQ